MSQHPIYLDYAAATPLDERVLAAMRPYLTEAFYNPSAAYASARNVRREVEAARETIARIIGVKPAELIFTAGATESINLAVTSIRDAYPDGHIITTAIDHPAVLRTVQSVADHTLIPVGPTGRLGITELEKAITDTTTLVSVGYVNSEIGTIQPLKEIARLIRAVRAERTARGSDTPIFFHTDASQATGHIGIHVSRLGVDMMTINAGKAYGPKQAGVLYAAAAVPLRPYVLGGGQERSLRSGTENVAGIIGMAEAFTIAEAARAAEVRRLQALRQGAAAQLVSRIPGSVVNGDAKYGSPHILSISIPGVDGERLLMELDERGIMVATGSACAANKDTKSHVLSGIGLPDELISGSLRLSFGRNTTGEQLSLAVDVICELAVRQRERQYA